MVKLKDLSIGWVYQLPVGRGKLIGFEHFGEYHNEPYGSIVFWTTENTRRAVFELLPGHTWPAKNSLYYAWANQIGASNGKQT